MKNIIVGVVGIICGVGVGYAAINYRDKLPNIILSPIPAAISPRVEKDQVIGFLPYWLLDKAQGDYAKYITTLTYFGLTLDGSGRLQKFVNPGEAEPGWYALASGKFDQFAAYARAHNIKLSLVVFSGSETSISAMMNDPAGSASNLLAEAVPLMRQYGFSDLNLDIEDVAEASNSARLQFTQFVRAVKTRLALQGISSLTVEVTSNDAVKNKLIDVGEVAQIADQVMIMAYDYHFAGSLVTGPVSPVGGGGERYEFDVKTAVDQALKKVPAEKIILGIPLYGYEWETLGEASSSAVIPGSGQVASNARVEQLLATCNNCQEAYDSTAGETYVVYKDQATGTFHQIFYPDAAAMVEKIQLAKKDKLAGVGLWALGYEGTAILQPLETFLK